MYRASILATVVFASIASSSGSAQEPLRPHFAWEKVQVDSTSVDNPIKVEALIYRERVSVRSARWMQLVFAETTRLAPGSRLRITSTRDNGVQWFNSESLLQWSNQSALFNGNEVLLELFAAPHSTGNRVAVDRAMAGQPDIDSDSICGDFDNRVQSFEPRQGRLFVGCTGWLVNDDLMLTAGHCVDSGTTIIEFNVPDSTASGNIVRSNPNDQYPFTVLDSDDRGVGFDWSVNRVGPNSNTNLLPAQAQGGNYSLGSVPGFVASQTIRITGYGNTSPRDFLYLVQKTHTGPLVEIGPLELRYATDTTGGNSGSPVIDEASGLAIGIHTHAGCNTVGGNAGTRIDHPDFQNAFADANRVPAEIASIGESCSSGTIRSATCMSNNPLGGRLTNDDNRREYAIQLRTTQTTVVNGFEFFTQANAGSIMNTALYLDGGGVPAATPTATGTMSVSNTPGFYSTSFATPVSLPANTTFYIAGDFTNEAAFLPQLFGSTSGVGFFNNNGWARSGVLTNPSFRLLCDGTSMPTFGALDGPFIDEPYEMQLAGAPESTVALLLIGLSGTTFAGGSLPLALDVIGATGCSLYVGPLQTVGTVTSATGAAAVGFPVPNAQSLVGLDVFTQMVLVDPGANALGLMTTNGLRLTIGG